MLHLFRQEINIYNIQILYMHNNTKEKKSKIKKVSASAETLVDVTTHQTQNL